MKRAIMAAVTVLSTGAAFAETENFDQHKPGGKVKKVIRPL
jgi:hypothetical protein